MHQAERGARGGARQDSQKQAPGGHGRGVGDDAAEQHHAFDPQVHDAGLLAQDLPTDPNTRGVPAAIAITMNWITVELFTRRPRAETAVPIRIAREELASDHEQ